MGFPNISFIPQPVQVHNRVEDSHVPQPDIRVIQCAMLADVTCYGKGKSYRFFRENVWNESTFIVGHRSPVSGIPTLESLALRAASGFNMIFGSLNGRPRVISAKAGIEGTNKAARAVLQAVQPMSKLTPEMRLAIPYIPKSLEYMYMYMGVLKKMRTIRPEITLRHLQKMYLGSSSGILPGSKRVIDIATEDEKVRVRVKPTGKKIHVTQQVLLQVIEFLSGGAPPETLWAKSEKDENYFSSDKQFDDLKWSAFLEKLRTYEIPSQFFIVLETILHNARKIIEVGNMIMVGMKWARGGVDHFADIFGVKDGDESEYVFSDADFDKLDKKIHQVYMRMFEDSALVYYNKEDPMYPHMVRIAQYLAQRCSQRITHVFGQLWAVIEGGMPSGRWMTSHGDSWIVGLWFFTFCTMAISTAEEKDRILLERELLLCLVKIVIYGDDHIICIRRHPVVMKYFNIYCFAEWVKKYTGGELRDIRWDVGFESFASGGFHTYKGAVFLKQTFVRNTHKGEGQPKFLPFRPMNELLVRCVFGRDTRQRDIYDVILSSIGQAYNTYGSNESAYKWLFHFHTHMKRMIDPDSRSLAGALDRITQKTLLGKLRQADVTIDDLKRGFPTMQSLVAKNTYDKVYHIPSNSVEVPLILVPVQERNYD